MVGVPPEVVHLIRIDVSRYDLMKKTILVLGEDGGDIIGRLTEDRGDRFVFPDDTARYLLMRNIFPVDFLQGRLKDMGKWPVADVVEQGGVTKDRKIVTRDLQLLCHEGGDMKNTEGVLKTGVACSRVDQVCIGKLLDPPQPLEGWRV